MTDPPLTMEQLEQAHRHALERRGQWMAFVLTVLAIAATIYSIHQQQEVVAVLLGGFSLASILRTFLRR